MKKTDRINSILEKAGIPLFVSEGPRALQWFRRYEFCSGNGGYSISRGQAFRMLQQFNLNPDQLFARKKSQSLTIERVDQIPLVITLGMTVRVWFSHDNFQVGTVERVSVAKNTVFVLFNGAKRAQEFPSCYIYAL